MKKERINLAVNGETHDLLAAPNELWLNVLRDRLHLTGPKYVCGSDECGACTVSIDGALMLSCLMLAATADGSEITTIEGLAGVDGHLDPIQEAFLDHGAYQYG
jgi:aerobic-type carbon monoxide dehydrogenase small subunit (CoxS/CutS family)